MPRSRGQVLQSNQSFPALKKTKGTGGLVGRPDALVKVPGINHFSDNPLSLGGQA